MFASLYFPSFHFTSLHFTSLHFTSVLLHQFGITSSTKIGLIFLVFCGGYALFAPLFGWIADKTVSVDTVQYVIHHFLYNTSMRNSEKLQIPMCRTKALAAQQSFSYRAVDFCNSIPKSTTPVNSVKLFKNILKSSLMTHWLAPISSIK